MRRAIPFLLLALLAVVGGGAALLGLTTGDTGVALGTAVSNTLGAASYSEVLTEATPQGNQSAQIAYHAPDRLGGWIQSAGRRTYLVIIGSTEYVSVSVKVSDGDHHLVFYKQSTAGAQAVDPAHTYLVYWDRGPATTSGATTTVTLHQGGQSENLTFTVSGRYVSNFTAATPGGSIALKISNVDSAPAVALPEGATIRNGAPPASTGG